MSLGLYLAYIGATFIICGTPGPNMLLAMTHGINHGYRQTLATIAGMLTGLAIILLISFGGLGAILLASTRAFAVLKYAGAAYLIYLGIKTWRIKNSSLAPVDLPSLELKYGQRYRTGLLVSLFNPKAILFCCAFFPQFLEAGKPLLPQASLLLVTFMLIETSWQSAYAIGGARLALWLKQGTHMRWFNRVAGSAFIGAGIFLGTFRRT